MNPHKKIHIFFVYEDNKDGGSAFKKFSNLCSEELYSPGVLMSVKTDRGMYENSYVVSKDSIVKAFIYFNVRF